MGRLWRPVLVGATVVVATFVLAQLAVFEPLAPPAATLSGGDVYRGQVVFERTCASCHGAGGEGGSPGPPLVDTGLDALEVAAVVEQGRGVMPAALVSGQEQGDVVAYVVSIGAR
ncbi:MAG: c-type cytochrome [Actinomycetota bacterium]|nr:c-type cytochrome [Actinomycetota bacterium]